MARNDYLLAIDTANSAVQRFYCEDLHNIINVSRRPLSRVCASTAASSNCDCFLVVTLHITLVIKFQAKVDV